MVLSLQWGRNKFVAIVRRPLAGAIMATEDFSDEAFKAELIRFLPDMRGLARGLCRDSALGDDLAQGALLKAWRARTSFRLGTNMRAWLFHILRNHFYSERRLYARQVQLDEDKAANALVACDDASMPIELDDLRRALGCLHIDQREAVLLVGAAGLSYDEAAEVVGCPCGTVKSRVSRGRLELQRILEGREMPADGAPCEEAMASILGMAEHVRVRVA
jgi:RNA polymerase sigma-70 factor (ECF subfamily)